MRACRAATSIVISVIVAAVIAGPPNPYAIDEVAVPSVVKVVITMVVIAMVVMVIEGVSPIAVNVTAVP